MSATVGTLLPFDVEKRRAAASTGGVWHPLAASLTADLVPLHSRDAPIPAIKARLTRVGGRCARDGTLLDFDPWTPNEHRCSQCGSVYARREDFEWWAMGAQLWSVERAVHASSLHLLGKDAAHRAIATRILSRIVDQYLDWPNRDNVLGPSRPFFSTYLESIWLLNICHAISLLEMAGADPDTRRLTGAVRDRVIEPSLALISQYHEGLSNRQVWNEVAILSAMLLLGDRDAVDARINHRDGLKGLLSQGLLPDGTWYEGENYHQFAHRGLWYGVQLLSAIGHPLEPAFATRFGDGFVAPFLGVLPDETFPSRRDSQYRVSIRQWRFAEWCELGLSYREDSRLAKIRDTLYDGAVPCGDTGRSRSTADAERNTAPVALSRADCSWRALLMADVTPVEGARQAESPPASIVLESQGLAVILRDEGRTYVALEGGHAGGGHGHPDRLGLTLQCGNIRYLEDPGTGSYVDPTLHWYRSTLAHFAPLIDRKSQERSETTLLAFEDRGGVGWIVKRAMIATNVVVTRYVIVCDGYLVDVVEWDASEDPELTLPLCGPATYADDTMAWHTDAHIGVGGLEDGFNFAQDVECTEVAAETPLHLLFDTGGGDEGTGAQLFVALQPYGGAPAEGEEERRTAALVRATVPAPPGLGRTTRHWMRTTRNSGRIVSCWNWAMEGARNVTQFELLPSAAGIVRVTTADGTTADHSFADNQWVIALFAGNAQSSIELESWREVERSRTEGTNVDDRLDSERTLSSKKVDARPPQEVITLRRGVPYQWSLGEQHYLRTEESWQDAGGPSALIELCADDQLLNIVIDALTGSVVVPPSGADNPLDNERLDVNADGVQLYVGAVAGQPWTFGWLIVPSTPARITPLVPGQSELPSVSWAASASGWQMTISIPRALLPARDGRVVMDVIVNERPGVRERRRGQLVLSGGGGFAYLRGDRHDSGRAITIGLP